MTVGKVLRLSSIWKVAGLSSSIRLGARSRPKLWYPTQISNSLPNIWARVRTDQRFSSIIFSFQQLTRPKYGVLTEEERTELLRRRFHGNNPNISDAELKETHTVVKGERTCEQIINTISQGQILRHRVAIFAC